MENQSIFKISFKIVGQKKEPSKTHIILQNKEEGHNKHYELTYKPTFVNIKYGKIGSTYQNKTHNFNTKEDALSYMRKTMTAKLKKGYKRIN